MIMAVSRDDTISYKSCIKEFILELNQHAPDALQHCPTRSAVVTLASPPAGSTRKVKFCRMSHTNPTLLSNQLFGGMNVHVVTLTTSQHR
jgi:hypothetical protein